MEMFFGVNSFDHCFVKVLCVVLEHAVLFVVYIVCDAHQVIQFLVVTEKLLLKFINVLLVWSRFKSDRLLDIQLILAIFFCH